MTKQFIGAVAAITLLFGISGCAQKAGTPPRVVPAEKAVWSAQPELESKLFETLKSTKYPPKFTLKMPRGFELTMREEPNRKSYFFYGPERKDHSRVVFMVNAFDSKVGSNKGSTLSESMQLSLNGIKKGRSGRWTNRVQEEGTIDGRNFARIYWSGEEPISKDLMDGFVYGTMAGDDFIMCAAQDRQKYHDEWLPVMEAAVYSFKLLP